jgi:hypothetical protein
MNRLLTAAAAALCAVGAVRGIVIHRVIEFGVRPCAIRTLVAVTTEAEAERPKLVI